MQVPKCPCVHLGSWEEMGFSRSVLVPAHVGQPMEIQFSALAFNGPPLLGIWGYGLK